jgi:hypothetical protein
MFGRHYFGGRHFGPRFFGDGGVIPATGASAAAVWAYVLPNGKSAGQNLVEINAGVLELLSRSCLDDQVQGAYTMGDVLRILVAVAAGTSRISAMGGGAAQVQFDAIDGSGVVVDADMQGSERVGVTLAPNEST